MTIFTFFRWDSCIWREHFGTSEVLVGPLFFLLLPMNLTMSRTHDDIVSFICKSNRKVHMQEYWYELVTLAYELFHALLLLHMNFIITLGAKSGSASPNDADRHRSERGASLAAKPGLPRKSSTKLACDLLILVHTTHKIVATCKSKQAWLLHLNRVRLNFGAGWRTLAYDGLLLHNQSTGWDWLATDSYDILRFICKSSN